MTKNVVVCCDGTNNGPRQPPTNVVHLFRLASPSRPEQAVYYDEGVGTEPPPDIRTGVVRTVRRWSGLAFGSGLLDNVEQAYRYMVDTFEPGDRLYLFGFSRGAYTVRVLAGLIQWFGLLRKSEAGRVAEIVRAYERLFDDGAPDRDRAVLPAKTKERLRHADEIRGTLSVDCPLHFVGVFDTVSSLGWAYEPKTFSFTAKMPNVRTVRHALALDERRAKFRTNRVFPVPGQDLKQVWFAGVHSDVGGGYKPGLDRLSRVPLRWMLSEAVAAGLIANPVVEREFDLDATVAQDEQAAQNESLSGAWWGLEYLPLPHRVEKSKGVWVEEKRVYRGEGWRRIKDGDLVSESVRRRTTPVKNAHWATATGKVRWEP